MPAISSPAPAKSAYMRPSFSRASLEMPTDERDRISYREKFRMQVKTNLYVHLNTDPQHMLAHCSTVYELEDRTRPSISSF